MQSETKRNRLLQLSSFVTGLTKSGFAGGTGIIVTPLLATVMTARESLGIALPLLFISDVVNFGLFWGQWDWKAIALVTPGGLVGILLTTRVVVRLPEYWLKKSIGILGLLFIPLQILRMTVWQSFDPGSFSIEAQIALGLITGLATGVFTTMAHVGGMVSTIYFLLVLPKEGINATLVGSATVVYFLLNLLKLVTFTRGGLITKDTMRQVPRMLPMLAVGLLVGKGVNMFFGGSRVDWFIYVVLGIGGVLAWRLLMAPRPVEIAMNQPTDPLTKT